MADDLFQGLPPPSTNPVPVPVPVPSKLPVPSLKQDKRGPTPALKSALKRSKIDPTPLNRGDPPEPQEEVLPQKRLRFKTTVDATENQIIEAMQKIASHIKNPSKFSKASKLALQLIQAGSIKPSTSDHFFAILDGAMSSPSACTDPLLRVDYQALFSAVAEIAEQCFSKQQKNQLASWNLRAVVANDLYTDDSFVYSKAAAKIKEVISSLPSATAEDDEEESATFAKAESEAVATESNEEIFDPFGLDALLPCTSRKEERPRPKDTTASNNMADEEEFKRFIKSQREALLICLETAARRYKTPWAQTVIDILVNQAFDNIQRFTCQQRGAIERLWASVKEQQIRRKQGKSVTGKLDMNAFEWLQEKYANEKISIRHAVGGGGERRAQQWLG